MTRDVLARIERIAKWIGIERRHLDAEVRRVADERIETPEEIRGVIARAIDRQDSETVAPGATTAEAMVHGIRWSIEHDILPAFPADRSLAPLAEGLRQLAADVDALEEVRGEDGAICDLAACDRPFKRSK